MSSQKLHALQAGDELLLNVGANFSPTSFDVTRSLCDVEPVPDGALEGGGRGFTVGMELDGSGGLAGKTVGAAGLRRLRSAFLVAIERPGMAINAPGPDEVRRGPSKGS